MRALQALVASRGLSLTTVAVAWVLANPVVTAPIIGASRPEQVADTLKANELSLDQELLAKLDELTSEYRRGNAERSLLSRAFGAAERRLVSFYRNIRP